MKFLDWLGCWFGRNRTASPFDDLTTSANDPMAMPGSITDPGDDHVINPASGLPMLNGSSGFDVAGNPYGCDFTDDLMDHDDPLFASDDCNADFDSGHDSWHDHPDW